MLDKERYIGNKPSFGNFFKQTLIGNSSTTIFNLDFVAPSEESLLVVDISALGTTKILVPEVDFTIISSGLQIQFAVAPATTHSVLVLFLGQLLLVPTAGTFVPGSIYPADVNGDYRKSLVKRFLINSNTTLISNSINYVDTISGAVTGLLPASPEFGDTIVIYDLYKNFFINNFIVSRNGKNIDGVASNFTETRNESIITLVYIDNTLGWHLHSTGESPTSIAKIYYLTS